MKTSSLMLGATMGALYLSVFALGPAGAKTADAPHAAAIEACSAMNPVQPVELAGVADDGSGIGFSLVWLTDSDGALWMCDADDTGAVYSYTLVEGDLLDGYGPELIGLQLATDGGYDEQPQVIAEKVCAAYLDDGGVVLSSQPDGLDIDPGYAIFVEDEVGDLYLCNATGDAMVWAFEAINEPIYEEGNTAVS